MINLFSLLHPQRARWSIKQDHSGFPQGGAEQVLPKKNRMIAWADKLSRCPHKGQSAYVEATWSNAVRRKGWARQIVPFGDIRQSKETRGLFPDGLNELRSPLKRQRIITELNLLRLSSSFTSINNHAIITSDISPELVPMASQGATPNFDKMLFSFYLSHCTRLIKMELGHLQGTFAIYQLFLQW